MIRASDEAMLRDQTASIETDSETMTGHLRGII